MYSKYAFFMLFACLIGLGSCNSSTDDNGQSASQTGRKPKIQVALLLDTSGSMDGLIDQAKSRLWNIVNTLTTLRYNGQVPTIEISLYEYGNSGLTEQSGYIRQVSPLSTDLDAISEKLFALYTNGGDEYCGAVIRNASNKLDWGTGESDMKLIYIAGNEEFDQGDIQYTKAIADARKKDIYINTIFCGDPEETTHTLWKQGAKAGSGNFFTINQNEEMTYIETPYDDEIANYNEQLNNTYVQYGSEGEEKKSNQVAQDANANIVSYSTFTDRAVSKSQSAYDNTSWDLVDKVKKDKNALKSLPKQELPQELKGKSEKEVEQYVTKKTKERDRIQKAIAELAKKRQAYIDQKMQELPDSKDLGAAIRRSVIAFAKTKGYTVAA